MIRGLVSKNINSPFAVPTQNSLVFFIALHSPYDGNPDEPINSKF